MLFVRASITSGPQPEATARMGVARHIARRYPLRQVARGYADIDCANCMVDIDEVDGLRAFLFRTDEAMSRPLEPGVLAGIVMQWRSGAHFLGPPLRGAFVLLLVDQEQGRVVILTDRFGIARVHVCTEGERLVLASDLGALRAGLSVPSSIDPQAIYDYVFYHCIPGPRTVFAGISKFALGR